MFIVGLEGFSKLYHLRWVSDAHSHQWYKVCGYTNQWLLPLGHRGTFHDVLYMTSIYVVWYQCKNCKT
jgi:hypothetical protein